VTHDSDVLLVGRLCSLRVWTYNHCPTSRLSECMGCARCVHTQHPIGGVSMAQISCAPD
jgi:hypothetical protein